MKIITIANDNLEKEHICCTIASNKEPQVISKKQWLSERFDDGLVFKKCDVHGKCFIEYIPAEKSWSPIDADGYMYINCFWVSGKLKGQGFSNLLLGECIRDSKHKDKKGLVILSSRKKRPFLSDYKYLSYKGFRLVDTAEPYYELMYLPFGENMLKPQFKSHAKKPNIEEQGFVLYYTNQCPYTAKYVPLIENLARERSVIFRSICLKTAEEAQNAPAPFTTYALFYNGEFITNEILSEKKFEKILAEKAL